MSGFAVIGWGSLIWDLETLSGHVTGAWRMGEGPSLPLEFSRVSPKRRMGLTVCLDPGFGEPCQSHWILSRRARIGEAIEDLAQRERAPAGMIGAVCLETGIAHGRLGPITSLVRGWCRMAGLAGAVWTDLDSNFEAHLGQKFSVFRAAAYLAGLAGDSRDEAVRYIENAPVTTDTPLRRALALEPWWLAEAARIRHLAEAAAAPLSPASPVTGPATPALDGAQPVSSLTSTSAATRSASDSGG